MRRIVEETLADGSVQYRVETNRILGFIPCGWHTDLVYDRKADSHFSAVFDDLEDAQIHCGIDTNPVVKRRVL